MAVPVSQARCTAAGSALMIARWLAPVWKMFKVARRVSPGLMTMGFRRGNCLRGRRSSGLMAMNFFTITSPLMLPLSPSCTKSLEWPQCITSAMVPSWRMVSRDNIFAVSIGSWMSFTSFRCKSSVPWIMSISSLESPVLAHIESSCSAMALCIRTKALILPRLKPSSSSWPKNVSSIKLMGHTMNSKTHFRTLTPGANLAAMESWFGPVNMADGMISPNTSTKETEMSTAAHAGTRLSRKTGNASFAIAFTTRRVTNK
mmetsp:Transcript_72414/g.155024  ORF Transcript_72414/g.155024 Transcript_72414/m.155024 type:complete len:259 (+) Transcript_72414:337-1113(+)